MPVKERGGRASTFFCKQCKNVKYPVIHSPIQIALRLSLEAHSFRHLVFQQTEQQAQSKPLQQLHRGRSGRRGPEVPLRPHQLPSDLHPRHDGLHPLLARPPLEDLLAGRVLLVAEGFTSGDDVDVNDDYNDGPVTGCWARTDSRPQPSEASDAASASFLL